ncbi:MAG: acetyl-CoA C-acetyltransferase [Chloroflexota bacterium]|nr:acetyl-CoA C-acetyltransferase [Chloroflexota bacterium]
MSRTVILSACRTPIGKFGGGLASLDAVELGGIAIREAIERSGAPASDIEHVLIGNVVGAGLGMVPSRQAAFRAGLGREVTSDTINRVCGSGMRAVNLADVLIRAGEHRVIVAGGMESMSNAPYLLRGARWGYRMNDGALEDAMIHDGLWDPIVHVHMGSHGSKVAAEEGVGRREQDEWALQSHRRAVAAQNSCYFSSQMVVVEVRDKKGNVTVVDRDEGPRPDTSIEALSKLRPVFDPEGTVTAGNAPSTNDGAAALVLASSEYAEAHGLKPLATVISTGNAAWDPPYLAYTPVMAADVALKRAGLTSQDMDLIELNEAFASVAIISTRRLGVDPERVNPNGGAIALGHPIGASGARVVTALAHELRRRGGGRGLAAICSGTAQGDAVVIEVDG